MAIILNIDTSTEQASICLAENGKKILTSKNNEQKDHAAWLHVAISDMMKEAGFKLSDLSSVALAEGPGSYTGLRVGMATAKGLCYALKIPLITEGTLKYMAFAAVAHIREKDTLICPMIDARRMEVFTALYHQDFSEIIPATAMVLDTTSFQKELHSSPIFFFGNGSNKWKAIAGYPNARFGEVSYDASDLAVLSYNKFLACKWTDLTYSEPLYIKDFHIYIKNL